MIHKKNNVLIILFILFLFNHLHVFSSKISPGLKFLESCRERNILEKLHTPGRGKFFNQDWVKVAIVFNDIPSTSLITDLENKGIKFNRLNGRILHTKKVYGAEVLWSLLNELENQEDILQIDPVWYPKELPTLDISVPEIEADRVWQFVDYNNMMIDGTGIRVVDFDTGIDAFHPGFFRADGLTYSWIDFNGDNDFDPGIDAVDLNNNSVMDANEVLDFWDGVFYDPWEVPSNNDGVFQCDMDWLFNDVNTNGSRDYGTASGFTESDPTYGELIFVVNDSNNNNTLDLGETLTALNSSRIYKSLNSGGVERTRGIDLIQDQGDSNGHGTGVCGVISSEVINKRRYVSVAPGSELLMADRYNNDYTVYIPWAETNGADIMLYEYGGFVWHFLDGSEAHEIMVNDEADKGIIQITPAGNLANSNKHISVNLAPGVNTCNFDIPADYSIQACYITVLWRDWDVNGLDFTIFEPSGSSVLLNGAGGWQTLGTHDVYSYRAQSTRNTYRMDIYIQGNSYVDVGAWYIEINNLNVTSGIINAYIADNVTSWSQGAVWTDAGYITDFPTICFPATSDKTIVVGLYGTRGITVPAGSLSLFSSRGDRIDGTFVMDITAPGNYDIRTVGSKDDYGEFGIYAWFGGTSASGPHVAAAAALIKQAEPTANHFSVESDIQNYAAADGETGAVPNNEWGYGKLRLFDLIDGKIFWDQVSTSGDLLFPEWSSGTPSWGTPGEKYITYIRSEGYGTSDVFIVNTTGLPEPKRITLDGDGVNHNSQISWSPDDEFVIFASTNIFNNLNIFKISSDPNDSAPATQATPESAFNWGRMLDPDWGSSINQFNSVERIVLSISGDIWVFEPNNNTDPNSGLVKLTELSDPYQDYENIDKCYQPKWSPDNTKVVFVRRPPTAGATPAASDIYVINNVQNIISEGRGPIDSWSDPDLQQITNSVFPEWSPSFSIDGTKIGYCRDVTSTFNNITFNDSPAQSLETTNFDAYDESGVSLGTPALTNSFDEGFVKWASSGGDKFIYIKEDNGFFKLRIIRDETIGGFSKSTFNEIKDHSFSSIKIDPDDYIRFSRIKFYSPYIPSKKIPG